MQTDFKTKYQTIVQAPINKVWEALTKPELVKQYFFGTELITDWQVGQPILFKGEWDTNTYEDKGTILSYQHEAQLSYSYLSSWSGKEDVPENYLIVTYELKTTEEGTELTITQTNYDEEKASHSHESWASVIDGLKTMLKN